MVPRLPEEAFIALLRSVYRNARHCNRARLTPRPPRLSALNCRTLRRYASTGAGDHDDGATRRGKTKTKEIAVLGGGITGLTTAHYLARYAPDAHVTLYEASDRLGGWIDAASVPAGNGREGEVLLQRGPRMLRSGSSSNRYDDLVLYDVIASLNLQGAMRHPSGSSGSRYLFYPDHLVKLPSGEPTLGGILETARSFLREPLWDGCMGAALSFRRKNDVSGLTVISDKFAALQNARRNGNGNYVLERLERRLARDESVAAFLGRVLGDERPVRNIVSGMLHGIYGGDAHRLSAKHTVLDRLWYQFASPRPRGQVWMPRKDWFLLYELMDGAGAASANADEIVRMAERALGWKLLAFDDGLVTLVRALVEDLERQGNVTVKCGEPVTSVANGSGHVLIETPKTGGQPAKYDHVISTLFSKHLTQVAQPASSLPSLAETHAVTIMVVNLWYPGQDLLANNHGFGYLVPTSTPDNDEGALGVLFDSDLATDPARSPPGTKLTVMLGGHHWDGYRYLPNVDTGIAMAMSVVRKHLGIEPGTTATEVHARAKLCRDCLPQHFVGHRPRMAAAHDELRAAFGGRLSVAGPSYTAIGVVPAMRAGWEAAMRVARPRSAALWFANAHKNPDAEWRAWCVSTLLEGEGETEGGQQQQQREEELVGHTGLEEFAVYEAAAMMPVWKKDLYFRRWTRPERRFTDSEGRWIEREQEQEDEEEGEEEQEPETDGEQKVRVDKKSFRVQPPGSGDVLHKDRT
ncbi:hypothetical protein DL762_006328 [Monosporascus cannonballus]|uniref:protoporphyrinogen oxidase n=1 Tax=Monosporascus cannonballus TaxID=155416 RepID=A0ABY0H6J8_9PEZI|nr:hypothetical protein DL762_006328 [Monosporascus cannonballus]